MRKVWTGLAATFVVAVVLAAAPVTAAEKIVISQWDAYWPPDLLANFTKETGIEAEWAVQIDNEDMMGKVTTSGGKGYDVVFASSPFVEALAKLGLIAELDHGKLPEPRQPLSRRRRTCPTIPATSIRCPTPGAPPVCAIAAICVKTGADELGRSAEARRRPQGQDHHAVDPPLADGGRPEGARLFGQQHRPGRNWPKPRTC